MTNNDILRRLRYAFDFSDQTAANLFSTDPAMSISMSKADFLARIAKPDDAHFIHCTDHELAAFLDGLVVSKRGLREPQPEVKNIPD